MNNNREELERIYFGFDKSIAKTARYFGYTYSGMKYKLNSNGIKTFLEKNCEDVDINDLESIYLKTQSIRKTGDYFNFSHEKARYLLRKHNLINKPIEYNHDKNFFANDNEKSFYWAGFIAADGSILDNKSSLILSLGLSLKDKSHLLLFKEHINAENPVLDKIIRNSLRNPKWNDSKACDLQITSNKLCKDLKRFNIVPRKSLIYTFPEWLVGHSMVHYFMRGYFDGDGSFFYNLGENKNVKQMFLSLRGTSKFLRVFRNILEKNCGIKKRDKPVRISSGIGVLEYGGNGVLYKICKFLYSDANVYLNRKYNIVEEFLNDYEIRLNERYIREKNKNDLIFRRHSLKWFKTYHHELTGEHLRYLYNKYGTITNIAKIVHKGQSTISSLLKEYEII